MLHLVFYVVLPCKLFAVQGEVKCGASGVFEALRNYAVINTGSHYKPEQNQEVCLSLQG